MCSTWLPAVFGVITNRSVDGHPVLLAERRAVGQPQRDQALAQDVLHRLPEPQVDAERQRRDQLGQPGTRSAGPPSHQASLTFRDWPAAE
jgi:hypothetical protein